MRQQKRNVGPETRGDGPVKAGMFKKEEQLQNAGFSDQVPTTPQNKGMPPLRPNGGGGIGLRAALLGGRAAAQEGRSSSLRPHSDAGPALSLQQEQRTHGQGGNIDPSPSDGQVQASNSRGLKRAGVDATRTDTYTERSRLRGKR